MTQDPMEILEYNAQKALDFEDTINVVPLTLARECVRRAREEHPLEALIPLAEAYVNGLETQYEQTDDGAHYHTWQEAKTILEAVKCK